MEVTLRNKDFLDNEIKDAVYSARVCYNSFKHSDNGGKKDEELLEKLLKLGHHSILEQITLKFEIKGVSRALLQQEARHRIASRNYQSTRYTINKMVEDYSFKEYYKYFVKVNEMVDAINKQNVERIISILREQIAEENKLPNDKIKYLFPEALKTQGLVKYNFRSWLNFYKQRSDSHAMWEAQDLANNMYNELPPFLRKLVDIYVS